MCGGAQIPLQERQGLPIAPALELPRVPKVHSGPRVSEWRRHSTQRHTLPALRRALLLGACLSWSLQSPYRTLESRHNGGGGKLSLLPLIALIFFEVRLLWPLVALPAEPLLTRPSDLPVPLPSEPSVALPTDPMLVRVSQFQALSLGPAHHQAGRP